MLSLRCARAARVKTALATPLNYGKSTVTTHREALTPLAQDFGKRSFHSKLFKSGSSSSFTTNNNTTYSKTMLPLLLSDPFAQQVRWKRNDGNKFSVKPKTPSKKQVKKYNRKQKARREVYAHHGEPGSKAGARREFKEFLRQDIINPAPPLEQLEYDSNDALLDDIVGNSAYLTFQPTPEPAYLGHKYEEYKANVTQQLAEYLKGIKLIESRAVDVSSKEIAAIRLPTDHEISLALRAFRDKSGTKSKPAGLYKSLAFVLQELNIPIAILGEHTFTTLMTCASNPAEGRRVMQIMNQQGHPVSSYSWSILVDIYSKSGDFAGAAKVQQEMLENGVSPTLASYTSLIAACARYCKDGRNAHNLRSNAGKLAWEKWQEIRVVGLQPDALAYGAILQVMAAQGQPEKALNILEEMQQLQVKPTTLCFTNTFRAVARSHATAIRYERGSSKKNKRRETITLHHGRLVQKTLVMAENAEVTQDEGFIAALIMCAASTGDLATAKAIYVANQLRKLTELRTIGSDEHLALLRGESPKEEKDAMLEITSGNCNNTFADSAQANTSLTTFAEREYGKDSRVLSAILHACAVANDPNNVGTIWQGRENQGLLCENSLRLMKARRVPRYASVPSPRPDAGYEPYASRKGKDEDYRKGKREGNSFVQDGFNDELYDTATYDDDEELRPSDVFLKGDVQVKKKKNAKLTVAEMWEMKYGESVDDIEEIEVKRNELNGEKTLQLVERSFQGNTEVASFENGTKPEPEEMYFDKEERKWKIVSKVDYEDSTKSTESTPDKMPAEKNSIPYNELTAKEVKNDTESRRSSIDGRHKPTEKKISSVPKTAYEEQILQNSQLQTVKEDDIHLDFDVFYNDLLLEIADSNEDIGDISKDEAMDLFLAMREEFEGLKMGGKNNTFFLEKADDKPDNAISAIDAIKDSWRNDGYNVDVEDEFNGDDIASGSSTVQSYQNSEATSILENNDANTRIYTPEVMPREQKITQLAQTATMTIDDFMPNDELLSDADLRDLTSDFMPQTNEEKLSEIDVLRSVVPGFPKERLKKIVKIFKSNLTSPSMIDLTISVREIMPDYITNTWLKQMSALTARYVAMKAAQDGVVDTHILNSYLEIETSAGSIDRAIEFLQNGFDENNVQPTRYSYRLVIQMLLRNNRIRRALQLKQEIEASGDSVDLLTYGSLVDYCSRRNQLGSAVLLLKECVAKHGSPPSEFYLKELRQLSRKHNLEDKLQLEIYAGKDPLEWLRDGEANLKREYSKKGRRDILHAKNRLLQL